MKKLILISSVVASSLMAASCVYKPNQKDVDANAAFQSDPNKCFNAYDSQNISTASLLTKTAGKSFDLYIYKKPSCKVSEVTYTVVSSTGKELAKDTIPANEWNVVNLNIPNSYKDVKVTFDYSRTYFNNNVEQVTCPVTYTKVASLNTLYNQEPTDAVFGVPTGINTYTCYKYTTRQEAKHDESTDDFAIKPDLFNILFKKGTVKVGSTTLATIESKNGANPAQITTNYNNSSLNLNVTGDAQYSFDIQNGSTNAAQFVFLKKGTQTITITDTHYTDVDKGEEVNANNPTSDSCRYVTGSATINVIEPSKSWAGTGTGEAENNPTNNSINSTIKQNTHKDLHFKKMGW